MCIGPIVRRIDKVVESSNNVFEVNYMGPMYSIHFCPIEIKNYKWVLDEIVIVKVENDSCFRPSRKTPIFEITCVTDGACILTTISARVPLTPWVGVLPMILSSEEILARCVSLDFRLSGLCWAFVLNGLSK